MPSRSLGTNGAIKVRPGDSVSQIASDLFDLPPVKTKHLWKDFKRPVTNNAGQVTGFKDLANVNLIYPGEVLYYRGSGTQSVSFPETSIVGTPWVQVRFRLFLDYEKISFKIVESTHFHGRLFAKFSDAPDTFYAWDWFDTVSVGTTLSFKFDFIDAGSIISKWSSPVEFNLSEFDPRNYWKIVKPVLSFSLSELKVASGIGLSLKFVFPPKNRFIRKNGARAGNVTSVVKSLEIAGKDSASQFPSVSGSAAVSLNLKGFQAFSKKKEPKPGN